MDNYPAHLAPLKRGEIPQKEPFSTWWERVGRSFPTVPRNVARQWLWRHWGFSEYGPLPSAHCRFTLERWSSAAVGQIEEPYAEPGDLVARGAYLRSLGRKPACSRYRLARVMERRRTWPAPPIVVRLDGPDVIPRLWDQPLGVYVIEGHRRLAIARDMLNTGDLAGEHLVWMMTLTTPDAV